MLGVLAATPVILALAGASGERFCRQRDRKRFPIPDRKADVGGHELHYALRGEGDPLIVLEADEANWSTHWGDLPDRLARHSSVLTYDRAGLGWSAPGPGPRTVDTLARELHQLLVRVAHGRRVLIVGHGSGGSVARMYGHRYPFETAGMVLLDPPHEGLADVLRHNSIPVPSTSPGFLRLLGLGNAVGLLRARKLHPAVPALPGLALGPRALEALVARGYEPAYLGAVLAEELGRPASEAQLARLKDNFEFPVHVLVAGATLPATSAPKGYPVDEFNRFWVEQAHAFGETLANARIEVLEGAHHHLPLAAPDAVVAAVLAALALAREHAAAETAD